MILRGDGEVGAAHLAPGQAQPLEGLGAGDLVDEVEVDVEQVGGAVGACGQMSAQIPDSD